MTCLFFTVFGLSPHSRTKCAMNKGADARPLCSTSCVYCVFQEMLGLTKPAAPGLQSRPLAPEDTTASCRYVGAEAPPCLCASE